MHVLPQRHALSPCGSCSKKHWQLVCACAVYMKRTCASHKLEAFGLCIVGFSVKNAVYCDVFGFFRFKLVCGVRCHKSKLLI